MCLPDAESPSANFRVPQHSGGYRIVRFLYTFMMPTPHSGTLMNHQIRICLSVNADHSQDTWIDWIASRTCALVPRSCGIRQKFGKLFISNAFSNLHVFVARRRLLRYATVYASSSTEINYPPGWRSSSDPSLHIHVQYGIR